MDKEKQLYESGFSRCVAGMTKSYAEQFCVNQAQRAALENYFSSAKPIDETVKTAKPIDETVKTAKPIDETVNTEVPIDNAARPVSADVTETAAPADTAAPVDTAAPAKPKAKRKQK